MVEMGLEVVVVDEEVDKKVDEEVDKEVDKEVDEEVMVAGWLLVGACLPVN